MLKTYQTKVHFNKLIFTLNRARECFLCYLLLFRVLINAEITNKIKVNKNITSIYALIS